MANDDDEHSKVDLNIDFSIKRCYLKLFFLHCCIFFSRSPRKREANISPKRSGVVAEAEVPSKKVNVEKADGTAMGSFLTNGSNFQNFEVAIRFFSFIMISDDYLEMTLTSTANTAKTTENKIPEVHAETHSKKIEAISAGADEMQGEQPSVSEKGFFLFGNINFF